VLFEFIAVLVCEPFYTNQLIILDQSSPSMSDPVVSKKNPLLPSLDSGRLLFLASSVGISRVLYTCIDISDCYRGVKERGGAKLRVVCLVCIFLAYPEGLI
jgi:hypothetical protein